MTRSGIELGDLQRRRAELLGPEGQAWIGRLPALIAEVEARWQIRIDAQLAGGTEALVLSATTRGGTPVVLKLGQPGGLRQEIRALELADGRGYAKLLAADAANDALLLEALGDKLIDAGLPVAEQMEIIIRTLRDTWVTPSDPSGLMTGAEKARWHLDWMRTQWPALDAPCPESVIEQGLAYAEEREAAFSAADSVLVHGDSHAWNTLAVPDRPGTYKLVDPDGYFMEPAYDLGISMREWIDEYLGRDGARIARARAARLGALTGVPEAPIWQWGFIELVSSGLGYAQLGQPDSARPYFQAAERLLGA
jgi:streptomycin 6-kinase